jgi:hypothetical protein
MQVMSQSDNEDPNTSPIVEEETCPKCGYKAPSATMEQHECEGANSEIT